MLKQICILMLVVITIPFSTIYSQKYLNQYHFKSFPNPSMKQKASHLNEVDLINSYINSQYQSKQKINGGINKIDSIIVNSVSGAKNKLTFFYDETGRIVSYKTGIYLSSGSYSYYMQDTNTYDSSGNLLSVLTTSLNGEKWDYDRRQDFTYNAKGNRILQLDQLWQNGKWENAFRVITSYNSDENLVMTTTEYWVDSVWVNAYKITTEYFSDGLKIAILFQKWQNGTWENMWLTNLFYNNDNRVTSTISKEWDGKTWTNYLRMKATYNSSNTNIVKLVAVWDNGKWIDYYRNFETYNDDKYFTHGISEFWEYGSWYPEDGSIDLYNPDGFELHYLAHEMLVYYNETTSIKVENTNNVNGFELFQNYPNPFNPSTTINYQIPSNSFVTLKVYDVLGNEIAMLVNEEKAAGAYQVNFSAQQTTNNKPLASGMSSKGGYASGVYFYTLTAGKFTATKKFILMK